MTYRVGSSAASSHPRDFSINVSPAGFNLHPVENVSSNVMLASIGGFSGVITLTTTILPNIKIAPILSVVPSSVRLKSGATANSTLSISVNGQTGLGNYTVTVTAHSDETIHSSQVNVFVQPPPDFSITIQPSAETVSQGSTRNSSYTLTSFFGFSGTISLTISNVPANVSLTVQSPQPLSPGGSFTGSLSVSVQNNAVPGTHFINFIGHSGSITENATLTLIISQGPTPDFTIATNPSFLSIPQGSTGMVFVALSGIGGFNGTVSLTSRVIPVISGGPTTVLNQSSVFVFSGSSRGVGLRIITTPSTTTGSYNYTVTGTSGSLTHSAIGAFTVTSSPSQDFSISASPTSLTVPQGSSSRIFLNLTSLNSFGGTISLSAAVSPTGPGLVLGANSVTLNPGGTTQVVLGVFVNSTVPPPPGNYLITATGTSGSLIHSVNVQLIVTSSSASLVLVSDSFQPTNVTLQLQNQGGASITLSSYQVLDSSHNNWTRVGWSGPTLTPGANAIATVLIGASCTSCTYSGVAGAFAQFTPGNTYTITVIGFGQAFQFNVRYSTATEGLALDSFSFFSGTNVTLFLRNIGNVSIGFVSYYVKDASGDQYALTAWSGPTITPGSVFPAQVLIGSSCPGCALVGSAFTFTPGFTYTIILVTSRNTQFSFTVTR